MSIIKYSLLVLQEMTNAEYQAMLDEQEREYQASRAAWMKKNGLTEGKISRDVYNLEFMPNTLNYI